MHNNFRLTGIMYVIIMYLTMCAMELGRFAVMCNDFLYTVVYIYNVLRDIHMYVETACFITLRVMPSKNTTM